MQKQPSIGFLKKGYYGFFFSLKKKKKQKTKNLKMVGSSKNIKLHFTKNNLFHKHFSGIIPQTPRRMAVGGRFQNIRYKKKIDLRDYFNKTILFVKNFKINHQKLIDNSKGSQKLKRVPYVLKNHNIYSAFSLTITFFKSETLSKKLL